jgi:hypothetical protein
VPVAGEDSTSSVAPISSGRAPSRPVLHAGVTILRRVTADAVESDMCRRRQQSGTPAIVARGNSMRARGVRGARAQHAERDRIRLSPRGSVLP